MGGRGKSPSSRFSMCSPPDRGGIPESRFPQGHDVPAYDNIAAEIEVHLHISGAAGVIGDGVGAAGDGLTVVVRQRQARLLLEGQIGPPAPPATAAPSGCGPAAPPSASPAAPAMPGGRHRPWRSPGVREGRAVQAVSSIISRHSPARQRFTGTQLLSFFP